MAIFWHFWSSEVHIYQRTLPIIWVLWFLSGAAQVFLRCGSRYMELSQNSQKQICFTQIVIFLALPVILEGYMSQNTPYNLYIAVLLRGRTTFCDFPFARYGFWAILGVLGLIWARKLGFPSQKKLALKLILFLEASVSDFNGENKINKKWTRD